MKKILFILMSVFVMATSFAQPHKESTTLLDNVYVGVNVGVASHLQDMNHVSAQRMDYGIEVGKDVTPLIGASVTFDAWVNTSNQKTAFDETLLMFNGKLNLSNLIWGYKPDRKVEWSFVPAVGWRKYHGDSKDDMAVRLATQLDYNVNDAWQIYIKPGVVYPHDFHVHGAMFNAKIGVTYRFKNHQGKHRMVMCENLYTQDDYKLLMARYNDLLNRKPDTIKELVHDTVYVHFNVNEYVYFDYDSYNLPVNTKICVTGYASEEGSDEYNSSLCFNRAIAVKKALVSKGYKESDIDVKIGGKTNKFGPNLEDNRVVTITTK